MERGYGIVPFYTLTCIYLLASNCCCTQQWMSSVCYRIWNNINRNSISWKLYDETSYIYRKIRWSLFLYSSAYIFRLIIKQNFETPTFKTNTIVQTIECKKGTKFPRVLSHIPSHISWKRSYPIYSFKKPVTWARNGTGIGIVPIYTLTLIYIVSQQINFIHFFKKWR